MKKKGLIISTVVMVVVLIASLTTATFAWFTASGSAKVDSIDFGVAAASDLLIGVAKNNKFDSALDSSGFTADNTTYTATVASGNRGSWTGDTEGLGLGVNLNLQLGALEKAVYSFNDVIYKTPGQAYDKVNNPITSAKQDAYARTSTSVTDPQQVATGLKYDGTVLKASGNGNSFTASSCEPAVRNTDYLDVVFGVTANKADVLNYGCLISIDNKLSKSTLGMNAAIHIIYSTDGTNYKEIDVYGTQTASTVHNNMTAPTLPKNTIKASSTDASTTEVSYVSSAVTEYVPGDAIYWIPLRTADDATDFATVGAITQLHLIVYICGPDGDCLTSSTGAGAAIQIEFIDINKTMFENAKKGN